jgi:hypothetical protein
MTYVVGKACVDVMDKSSVQECPVDCIYEGSRAMYINPEECVNAKLGGVGVDTRLVAATPRLDP